MGKLEKITANMELTESKKFKFQKAILAMMLEWKHLEEYMDSTQHSFQECLDELQLKEKYLNSVQESAVESNKEMESVRVSIEGRIKELDDKKREFQVFRDELVNELDFKKKQLGLIGKSIEERIKLVEFREEKLAVEEKQFEDIRKSVGERIQDINSKGMLLEKRSKELDAKEEDIERRYKELESKDIEKGFKELESKDKELGDRVRKIESMVKQISNEDIQMLGVGGSERGTDRNLGKRPVGDGDEDLSQYSGRPKTVVSLHPHDLDSNNGFRCNSSLKDNLNNDNTTHSNDNMNSSNNIGIGGLNTICQLRFTRLFTTFRSGSYTY